MKTTLLLAAVLMTAGCSRDVPLGPNDPAAPDANPDDPAPGPYQPVLIVPPEPIVDLDILFVIDNSGSMNPHHEALVAAAGESLFAQLDDEMPSVHIGVVSTDLGTGYNIGACWGDGDDGLLQSAPRVDGCSPPDGAFIRDVALPGGGREQNYAGTLEETFSCIAQLGDQGCGFEQPLEAMRRALDGTHPENAGFLRAEAALLVVIISDEDDCSTADRAMFDPAQRSLDDPLGPFGSYRCTEFGVVCDPDTPRTVGVYDGCQPREDSPYMYGVSEYVDFLRALKPDPTMVMVGGIFGDPSHFEVESNVNGHPTLASQPSGPGCPAESRLDPAVRLTALATELPARYSVHWMCQDSMAQQLAEVASLASGVMSRGTCMAAAEPSTCRAFEAEGLYTAGEIRRALRACGTDGDGPCFALVEDADRCPGAASRMAVEVRDGALAPGAHLLVECLAAPAP